MWKTLVGKFQPLPASSYNDTQNERDLERTWDERDTTGLAAIPENATSQADLRQLRDAFYGCMETEDGQVSSGTIAPRAACLWPGFTPVVVRSMPIN
ncbi:hypothetical protein BGX28_008049 [Mortierella sp. GBA30]|nr:hypothetical protein BGX28_008049 [Mortierella sp. GBA30]